MRLMQTTSTKSEMETRCPGLQNLLETSSSPDVTIITDTKPHQQTHKLHRTILTSRSSFFETACREPATYQTPMSTIFGTSSPFTSFSADSGSHRIIHLPYIQSSTFAIVVRWLYSGQNGLMDAIDSERTVVDVYKAAAYFDMPGLKYDILELVRSCVEWEAVYGGDHSGDRVGSSGSESESLVGDEVRREETEGVMIVSPYEIGCQLAEHSGLGDWEMLRRLADAIILGRGFERGELWDSGRRKGKGGGAGLFNMILIDAYQKILGGVFCSKKCLVEGRGGDRRCKGCRRRM